MRRRRSKVLLALAVLAVPSVLVLPGPLAAQQEDCDWLAPTENFSRRAFGASVMVRVTDAHLRCRDGTVIRADSARVYENEEYYQLLGNVSYDTPEQRLTGQIVRYWRNQGQLQARQDVTLLRKSDGTRVTGQELDYFQAGPTRPDDLLEVQGGRPHATFYPAGEEGLGAEAEADEEPFELDANRIVVRGRNRIHASGNVEVHRDSLDAFAEELDYDTSVGELVLRDRARMVTPGYELDADTIRALMEEGEVRDLVAIDRAILTGEDLRLAAPRIVLFLPEGALERLVARRAAEPSGGPAPGLEDEVVEEPVDVLAMEHPPRPVARAEDFLMLADSIDVRAPGEVLEQLVAVGSARAESTARDSLNTEATPAIARRDWIDGDTIVATFSRIPPGDEEPVAGPAEVAVAGPPDTLPVDEVSLEAGGDAEPDTVRDEYRLERLVARVGARSLYRLTPSDTTDVAPGPDAAPSSRLALHYVTGHQITLILDRGEIDRMEVVGQTQGLHLEPRAPEAPVPDTVADPGPGEAAADTGRTARPAPSSPARTAPGAPPSGLPDPSASARERPR